jgi:hypothetical protein
MSDRLAEIVLDIRTTETALIASTRTTLEHARRIGELLIEAKKIVPHGGWAAWVKANCAFAQRQAEVYRQIAKGWAKLEKYKDRGLSLTEARDILARPKGKGKGKEEVAQKAAPQEEAVQETPVHETVEGEPQPPKVYDPKPEEAFPAPDLGAYLYDLMARHRIVGAASDLMSLLAELGVTQEMLAGRRAA